MQPSPLIERLAKLPRGQRFVLFGLVYVLVGLLFAFTMYFPASSELEDLSANKKNLENQKRLVQQRVLRLLLARGDLARGRVGDAGREHGPVRQRVRVAAAREVQAAQLVHGVVQAAVPVGRLRVRDDALAGDVGHGLACSTSDGSAFICHQAAKQGQMFGLARI